MLTIVILSVVIVLLLISNLLFIWRNQNYRLQHHNALQNLEQNEFRLTQEKAQCEQQLSQLQHNINQHQEQAILLHSKLAAATQKITEQGLWLDKLTQTEQELHLLRQHNSQQQAELRELTTRLEETRLANDEKQRILTHSEQRLTEQFENLANRIFDASGRKVDEQNKQSLHGLLTPLREQLDGFRKQVQDSFTQEAKERHTLAFEIRSLKQLNEQMSQEANNLTKALKGDNKIQGNWGEVILNRILDSSGLREGHEYETQVSLKNDQGSRQQPDVIVHLPQEKDVIIDAKMTLIAYERFFNSQNDAEREQALSDHLLSVKNHMKLLSNKAYQQLPNVRTLDYVLMFIPIEPAFLLAIERDPNLINEALRQNIMLVSPTTLLIALRTIYNLWRYEYQNQNAMRIADRATKLYDKFRLFIDDMESLGQTLSKAQDNYKDAMKKLTSGRGNVISQIERFRDLGVPVKKAISQNITEQAKLEDGQYSEADDETNNLPLNEQTEQSTKQE